MTPDLSEFSYGFALTQELIDLAGAPLRAAPIFPSLIEEGKAGGGYDVHLDMPGFPLFLQFKRADYMSNWNAKEAVPPHNVPLPYYRMKLTEWSRSDQHKMLLDLDDGLNRVFYAAPQFHTIAELNEAYLARTVAARSFYITPTEIGPLDHKPHSVAFNAKHCWVCSEPKLAKGFRHEELTGNLTERLLADPRSLRDGPIHDALARAVEIARGRLLQTDFRSGRSFGEPRRGQDALALRDLRDLADISLSYFGTQLFIVQGK